MPHLSPVAPCDFLVFGGTGDLAMRKLLPALYLRDRDGQLPDHTRIFSISRAGLDDAGFRDKVESELKRHVGETADTARFLKRLHHVSLDVVAETDWSALSKALGDTAQIRVFYLACAPRLFGPISARAAANGLVNDASRVVLEKPIGHDLASARAINDEVGAVFTEEQIFRIDHYLGKETVQNLLVLRFANALLEPLWNAGHIDHVQITVAETIGIERPRRLLRRLRRAARHGAEPPAAAALPGGDGAAGHAGARGRARREAEGAAVAAPARRCGRAAADRARPVRRGPRRRRARARLPRPSSTVPATPRRSSR